MAFGRVNVAVGVKKPPDEPKFIPINLEDMSINGSTKLKAELPQELEKYIETYIEFGRVGGEYGYKSDDERTIKFLGFRTGGDVFDIVEEEVPILFYFQAFTVNNDIINKSEIKELFNDNYATEGEIKPTKVPYMETKGEIESAITESG